MIPPKVMDEMWHRMSPERLELEGAFTARMTEQGVVTLKPDRDSLKALRTHCDTDAENMRQALSDILGWEPPEAPNHVSVCRRIEARTGMSAPIGEKSKWTLKAIKQMAAAGIDPKTFECWATWKEAAHLAEWVTKIMAFTEPFRVVTPWPYNGGGCYITPNIPETATRLWSYYTTDSVHVIRTTFTPEAWHDGCWPTLKKVILTWPKSVRVLPVGPVAVVILSGEASLPSLHDVEWPPSPSSTR